MTASLKREKEKKRGWGWNVFTLSHDTKAALSVVWESTVTMMHAANAQFFSSPKTAISFSLNLELYIHDHVLIVFAED